MRHEPGASEVTEVFEAARNADGPPDTADDKTVPIRTPGATVSPEAEQAPEPQAPEPAPQQAPGREAAGLFGAVTVVPALLAAAWLLPGLPLLLAGRLTAPPLVFMFSPLARLPRRTAG